MQIAAPSILVGHDIAVARGDCIPGGGDVDGEEGLHHDVAGFAPVEARMGDDDLNAREQQCQEGDDCDPVGHADECRMAG